MYFFFFYCYSRSSWFITSSRLQQWQYHKVYSLLKWTVIISPCTTNYISLCFQMLTYRGNQLYDKPELSRCCALQYKKVSTLMELAQPSTDFFFDYKVEDCNIENRLQHPTKRKALDPSIKYTQKVIIRWCFTQPLVCVVSSTKQFSMTVLTR